MRALGALGMSVGTSLALELGGDAIRSADTLLFNLRTLIRNAQAAYEKDDAGSDDVNTLTKDVEEDLVKLGQYLEGLRKGKPIAMVVYYPSYKGLKSRYKYAELTDFLNNGTEKQKKFARLTKDVASALMSKHAKILTATDIGMPDFKGNGVVMTHHVVDLAEAPGYGRLFLLESYTGVLKPFTGWYTKLTGGEDLHYMPFNRLTIQIFGDRSTNFKSSSKAIKDLVKKTAIDGKWTSATSLSRVRNTIMNLDNQVDKAGLLMML
jgi:hypothetical protein